MDNHSENIELIYNNTERILKDPSHWKIRMGNYIIFCIALLVSLVFVEIKYPYSIKIPVMTILNEKESKVSINLQYAGLVSQLKPGMEIEIKLDNYLSENIYIFVTQIKKIYYNSNTHKYIIKIDTNDIYSLRNTFKTTSLNGEIKVELEESCLLEHFCRSF